MTQSPPPITARAGYVDIAPDLACEMGCGPTSQATLDTRDPIEANVIILEHHFLRAVLVSVDALYVGRAVGQAIIDGLRPWVAPEGVFMFASHSHTAPMLDPEKPALGRADPRHTAEVAKRIVGLVSRLVETRADPVEIRRGSCTARFAVSRRRRRFVSMSRNRTIQFNKVVMSPNLMATRPQISHIVTLSGTQGPIAIIWSLPCHPSALNIARFSADFPGYVRDRLREHFNCAVPVVFLQGFSGDLRPLAMHKGKGVKDFLLRALMGPRLGHFDPSAYEDWLCHMWSQIASVIGRLDPVSTSSGLRIRRVERLLSYVAKPVSVGSVNGAALSAQWLGVGALEILGLSAEPVSEWEERVEAIAPGRGIITAGCVGNVFGYAPVQSMFGEGGYEVDGFCRSFGLTGLRSDFDVRMTGVLREVLSQPGS